MRMQDLHDTRRLLLPPPAAIEPVTLEEFKTSLSLTACEGEAEDTTLDTLLMTHLRAARQECERIKGRAYIAQIWQQQSSHWPQQFLHWGAPLRISPCPVQQVLSLTALDANGVSTPLDLTQYWIDMLSEPTLIRPHWGFDWGQIWTGPLRRPGSILTEFIAGDLMPITADATTNRITARPLRTYTLNERLVFSNHGGALPAPLSADQWYYVINPVGSTVQLALTPSGAAIDLTDAGSGVHFIGQIPAEDRVLILMMATHFYENRLAITPDQHYELPFTLKNLLWQNRVGL